MVAADISERNSAWAISVRLLDPSSSRGNYLSRLCGKLFFVSGLLHPSHLLVFMTCSMVAFCVVRLAGIPWFVLVLDIKKSFHIGFSTLLVHYVSRHVKISAQCSQLWYTAQYIHTTPCTAQTPSIDHPTQTSPILPVSKDARSYEQNYGGRGQRNKASRKKGDAKE